MNQDFNNEKQPNRFIFSDDFYSKLDDEGEIKDNNILEPVHSINEIVNTLSVPVIENNSQEFQQPVIEQNDFINTPEIKNNINDEPPMETINEIKINIPEINIENEKPSTIEEVKEENHPDTSVNNYPKIIIEELDNFDQTPKINRGMEQELMKLNVEAEVKKNTLEQGKWFEEPQEKSLYRAARNKTPQTQIIDEVRDEPVTIEINPQLAEINKLFKQPEVINIDELLRQEEAVLIEKEKELKKEMEAKIPTIKSTILDDLRKKEMETGKISILARYGEDFCEKDYVTNPAIGRDEEIKQLILILLTPEKSGILVGKPGIGKTAIVEGLAYRLQKNLVPDALKGYCVISVKTTSLLGELPNGETRLQTLIDELKELDKIILFIDEIHMLMGATSESSLDFANMFKESLGRGSIKMIGATTSDEYERYVLRDKAFARRFQRVDVEEPSREHTIEILMGTLPKIEKNTGAKLKYSDYVKTEIMSFIVDITSEYKRVYGIGSRYPDICLTLLSQAFSQAVFDNRKEVNIFDVRNSIENSKNIYPDVIRKELVNFDKKFEKIIIEEKGL